MGKGDKKTRRGKITQGSYGKTRPRKSSEAIVAAKPATEKPAPKSKATKAKVEAVPNEEKPKTTRKKKTEE